MPKIIRRKKKDSAGIFGKGELEELDPEENLPLYVHPIKKLSVMDKTNFYAPGELGKTRRLTPEGFMVCEGVAIARTGEQRYHKSELPLTADGAGEITITRLPEEVFSEQTIQSFNGKPVTVEHPNEFVTPESWKRHAVGTVQNVRRGVGIEDDMLIADLLITDVGAIAYVNKDKPELSCGYDSEYEETGMGHAIQRSIVGNHVALVDRGRAGPRCAIRDHSTATEDNFIMKTSIGRSFVRALTAFQAKDQAALDHELRAMDAKDDDEEEETKAEKKAREAQESRDAKLNDALDWIASQKAKDAQMAKDAQEAKDAAAAAQAVKDKAAKDALTAEPAIAMPDLGVVLTGLETEAERSRKLKEFSARAEILNPGIRVGDSLKTNDGIAELMLTAVKAAYTTDSGKESVDPFLMGAKVDALTKDNVAGVFTGAAELMRRRNNSANAPGKLTTKDFGKTVTPESLNEVNRKFWATRT